MGEAIALIFEDKQKLVKGFSEYFIGLIKKKNGPFHVALSGGSTPKIWFEHLVKNHKDDIDWSQIQFYWGDERCVPADDKESNYGMTKSYLLDHIAIPKSNIHRIKGEISPELAAREYSSLLSSNLNNSGIPSLDLVMLGMGEDGHTASIFPHEIDLWDAKELCVVATHPTSGQHRVSFTGQVINAAKAVAFLVTGESKQEKVKEIFGEESNASAYPASLVKPLDGSVHWFLDASAAATL